MPSNTYNSTDTPMVIPLGSGGESDIVVTDSFIISDISINVQALAPDEGSGPDPTFVEFDVNNLINIVTLHNSTASSIANVTYDTGANPPDMDSLSIFIGALSNTTWGLILNNFSFIDTLTLNSWALTLSYAAPPNVSLVPTPPVARTIPGGIPYGPGIIPKKNMNVFMNLIGIVGASNIIDKVARVPFNSQLSRIKVTARNSGSAVQTKLSLYKVSNGVTTKLIDQGITIPTGGSYTYVTYMNRNSNIFNVNEGDIVYASVDQVGSGFQDLSLEFNLSEQ